MVEQKNSISVKAAKAAHTDPTATEVNKTGV
jgi:hypothetical protein